MCRGSLRKLALLVAAAGLFLAAPSGAFARDRHVYLDTDGDGTLNDCPNPAHNSKGIAGNTDDLKYCKAGSPHKLICDSPSGCKAWTTTTTACGAANVGNVVNGVSVDVDGDGTEEPLYGHPQACVFAMAKSDSCEVHAGTYRKPGAQCDANCSKTTTATDYNDYLATVLAYGYFADGHTDGYGTDAAPGYLRGAVMNGSTDTWDTNGNKTPDTAEGIASYPVVFSGDLNGNGAFDLTSCTTSGCTGDAFAGVWVGCGEAGGSGYDLECSTNLGSRTGPKLDTDANGAFDTEIGRSGTRNTDHLIIKDIELTKYNRGNGTTDGSARYREAIISLIGNTNTDGLKVDHIYLHGNQYNTGSGEIFWAGISDMKNSGCGGPGKPADDDYTEVKNSYLYQDNRFMFNTDGSAAPANGCSWNIHDNRIVMDVETSDPNHAPAIGYFKNLDYHVEDGRPYQVRFWNNEVIFKSALNGGWLFDLQHFGNSGGAGKGQVWVYGNLFRYDPSIVYKLNRFHPPFCSENNNETDRGTWYFFNNTVDGWASGTSIQLAALCSNGGDLTLFVSKNNVWTWTTEEDTTTAATVRISNEAMTDANRCSGASQYFTCGATPTLYSGLNYYAAYPGGGLAAKGTCDPDGDGVPGVDYDGTGVNETTWHDINGNVVNCPSLSATIAIGAIQGGAPSDTTPPANVQGLRRGDTSTP